MSWNSTHRPPDGVSVEQIRRFLFRAGCLLTGLGIALTGAVSPAAARSRFRQPTSIRRPQPNIVGGSDAAPGSFPWLAYISFTDGNNSYSCSGTVISSNLVLTAGHCVADETTGAFNPLSSYTVTTGMQNIANPAGQQVSGVSQSFLDGYDPVTDDRDIGILELSTPTTAPAIALATSPAALYAGNEVAIAGWGLTDPSDENSGPDQLQYASTVLQQPGFCATHAGVNFSFDAATELCTLDAPYDDDSVCYGDSGGPVVANELQGEPGTPTEIGVINSTINCSTSLTDYSARVDVYLPWAEQLIASLTPPATTETTASSTKLKTLLGTLPLATGKTDARTVLQGVFGTRFRRGQQVTLSCDRASKTRISCSTTWTYGPDDYYGSVITYLTVYKTKVVWTDRYLIRLVNDHCYFHTRQRASCAITRRAGTF